MHNVCTDPDLTLPESLVGVEAAWPVVDTLLICDGSTGMTGCIPATNGTKPAGTKPTDCLFAGTVQ
jgi:hypothetical protein